jgi:hypothetical protein
MEAKAKLSVHLANLDVKSSEMLLEEIIIIFHMSKTRKKTLSHMLQNLSSTEKQ